MSTIKVAKGENIISQYLFWRFFEVPRAIIKGWKNFLLFNLNYFSIPLLVKTFFSHWKKYRWYYGRGFNVARYLEVFFSNLISRILGAMMRSFLIFFGLIIEGFIFFAGLIVFALWFIAPTFLAAGLVFGFSVIF